MQVLELGNPKVKKGKEVPANFEVCEAAKPYLDANEEIPLPLMAKLVKFKLLDLKTADQKRRDTVGKKSPEKGKAKGKEKGSAGKDRGKSAKKGGGKKTPEPPSGKNESKLRKRGEEDPDAKYIGERLSTSSFHLWHLSVGLGVLIPSYLLKKCIRA